MVSVLDLLVREPETRGHVTVWLSNRKTEKKIKKKKKVQRKKAQKMSHHSSKPLGHYLLQETQPRYKVKARFQH